MTIEELILSKRYVTEGGIQYRTPEEYISPFLEVFADTQGIQYVVETADKVVNANADAEVNVAFGKVLVKANFEDVSLTLRNGRTELIKPTVGMLYNVGSQKPTAKIYCGFDVAVCMNMTVWNADHVAQLSLTESIEPIYAKALQFKNTMEETIQAAISFINKLDNKSFTKNTLNEFIGNLLKDSVNNVKLGSNNITGMTKSLFTSNSRYFVGQNFDNSGYWNVFNALTEAIGKSDVYERPTRVLQFSTYFNN